ncbi:hypothetical protein PUATCC27989T_05131 [Phytobacter ursingii]|nr:hypothetical protein TUM17576_05140 [Enterobacter hormaechei]VTP17136.1 hypothetical protein PUATCC27989T_05131 [Phytobacter ursingii]
MKKKSVHYRTSTHMPTQQTSPAESPQSFDYDDMLSELEAIVADAEQRLAQEDEAA